MCNPFLPSIVSLVINNHDTVDPPQKIGYKICSISSKTEGNESAQIA